jgi:uncharacterized glyoxalase superfamily protein PhnB
MTLPRDILRLHDGDEHQHRRAESGARFALLLPGFRLVHEKAHGSHPTPTDTERSYQRHWTPVHLDFHVSDFDDTLERATSAGAIVEKVFTKPKAVAFCSDPFGHGFCLIAK